MDNQKKAFLNYEADLWFDRNKYIIDGFNIDNDLIIEKLNQYNLYPRKILEIGSSAGYRLNGIKEKYKDCEAYGIDPSAKAIEYGKANYPTINLSIATIDELPFEKQTFDIVIVGFVFYVIDRDLLFRSIAEIDRVLKNKGILIIIDFFSERTLKNQYAHISSFQAYSFKQKYEDLFVSSQLYHLIDKTTYNHNSKRKDAQSDFHDLMNVTMLKKDIEAVYR